MNKPLYELMCIWSKREITTNSDTNSDNLIFKYPLLKDSNIDNKFRYSTGDIDSSGDIAVVAEAYK